MLISDCFEIVQWQYAVQLRVLGYGVGQLPPLPSPGYATAVTNAVSNFRKYGRIVGGQKPNADKIGPR